MEYQEYFFDDKRAYRKTETLTEIFNFLLKEKNITINGELYHHSNRENLYNKNLKVNFKTGEKYLPKYKNTETEILPIPFIDSIKNPMFNKSMSIVRKLLNELIINGLSFLFTIINVLSPFAIPNAVQNSLLRLNSIFQLEFRRYFWFCLLK